MTAEWVQPVGRRPGGWWWGDPWQDPAPVARYLSPSEASRYVIPSATGRRTRPEPCSCGGTVTEYEDGDVRCSMCVDVSRG